MIIIQAEVRLELTQRGETIHGRMHEIHEMRRRDGEVGEAGEAGEAVEAG